MFPHCSIHKYAWTSPDGRTHSQIDHVLIDKRWHSNKVHVHILEEVTVIMTLIWCLHKLGRDSENK